MIFKNESECGYKEDVSYPKFEGLTLMEPYSGKSYSISVPAGETKVILIRQSVRGHSYSSSYSSSIEKGEGALIAEALEKGERAERAEGIYVMKLQHSGGIIMVYKNETEVQLGQTLNETLGLELTGLELQG